MVTDLDGVLVGVALVTVLVLVLVLVGVALVTVLVAVGVALVTVRVGVGVGKGAHNKLDIAAANSGKDAKSSTPRYPLSSVAILDDKKAAVSGVTPIPIAIISVLLPSVKLLLIVDASADELASLFGLPSVNTRIFLSTVLDSVIVVRWSKAFERPSVKFVPPLPGEEIEFILEDNVLSTTLKSNISCEESEKEDKPICIPVLGEEFKYAANF